MENRRGEEISTLQGKNRCAQVSFLFDAENDEGIKGSRSPIVEVLVGFQVAKVCKMKTLAFCFHSDT